MKSIASKKAGPGGTSSYISHNLTQLYMHCNFGLSPKRYIRDSWARSSTLGFYYCLFTPANFVSWGSANELSSTVFFRFFGVGNINR